MLQIISGKFFKEHEELISAECEETIYSNFGWSSKIDTCVATLEPGEIQDSVSSYIIKYKNQIVKEPGSTGFQLIRIGDSEIIKQFKLLSTFGLQGCFSGEKNQIQRLCRKEKTHDDDTIPSTFTRRFLDNSIVGTKEEVDSFINFINKTIDLPRNVYKTVLGCISAYETSLKVLDQDINLAYSIMIYALETLSQSFDGYEACWEDYDQNQRIKLERCFEGIDDNKVTEIKNILVSSAHLKLAKRFVQFTMKHIENEFYCNQARQIDFPIRKSDTERLLVNAYNIRSGYVHNLLPLLKQITIPQIAQWEVFDWENEPYLTYRGLCRLTHHVIFNFVMKQPSLKNEEHDWRNDLPGIVSLQMAPQYWISNHEGFMQDHATRKLEGFLCLLCYKKFELIDIRELLKKYEKAIPTANEKYKIQMLVMYCLYNKIADEKSRIVHSDAFVDKYKNCLEICCIENLTRCLILNEEWSWDLVKCEETIIAYLKGKYKEKNIKLAWQIEVALFIAMANMFTKQKQMEKRGNWLERAFFDCPGQKDLQEYIASYLMNNEEVDMKELYRLF